MRWLKDLYLMSVLAVVVGGDSRTRNTETSESSQTAVIEQYTDYPYPAYGVGARVSDRAYYLLHTECHLGLCREVPKNTRHPKFYCYTTALDILNSYLYQGKESFEHNFRILLPGGGTGNTVEFLGEQLNHTSAEIVYVDFSLASMKIAQMRADMLGLSGISWFNDRIENIPNLNLGKFDLIECSGVLHHLPNPQHGLNILSDSLTDRGGMAIMVYGRFGRTGVYQMQELVRLVNMGVTNREEELQNLWKLLKSVDRKSLERRLDFRLNNDRGSFCNGIDSGRHDYWDTEAYDMLCHKQDRAYSATELFDFIHQAGLHFISLNGPGDKFVLSVNYQENFGKLDEKLGRHLKRLSEEDQIAIAELVDGGVDNHNIYASKIKDAEASFDDLNNVPYIYGEPKDLDIILKSALYSNKIKPNQPTQLKFRYQLDTPKGAWRVDWNVNETVKRMIDLIEHRNRTIEEVVDTIARETNKEKDQIFRECKQFHNEAKTTDLIILRGESVPNFAKGYKRTLFGLTFS